MVLHGEGPASNWGATRCRATSWGSPVLLRRLRLLQTRLLLLGDETVLPATRTILASLSDPLPVLWFAEAGDAQEIQGCRLFFCR